MSNSKSHSTAANMCFTPSGRYNKGIHSAEQWIRHGPAGASNVDKKIK